MPVSSDLTFTTLGPTPTSVTGSRDSPLWRIVITNLWDHYGVFGPAKPFTIYTTLDKLASDRVVTPLLNAPLVAEFTVPSDNPQVHIPAPAPDRDPYVDEGTRLAFWLRRESETDPIYTVRASTLLMQVEDTAQQDDARTRCVGYDPWQYLLQRPVRVSELSSNVAMRGTLLPEKGYTYRNMAVGDIVYDLISTSENYDGNTFIDYQDFGGDQIYEDTLVIKSFKISQGTTVGGAIAALTSAGHLDVVLTPVYPTAANFYALSPAKLCRLDIYKQIGEEKPEEVLAWDMPGKSLTQISRMQDGSSRANNVKIYAGAGSTKETLRQRNGDDPVIMGGVPFYNPVSDPASIAKYGEYWTQQFLPGLDFVSASIFANYQLGIRKNGRETVTVSPAPERSPRPFLDYYLGDRLPIWASAERFRKLIGALYDPNISTTEEDILATQFVRIYGFPIQISDDALETVTSMIVAYGDAQFSPDSAGTEITLYAIPAARAPLRRGSVQTP